MRLESPAGCRPRRHRSFGLPAAGDEGQFVHHAVALLSDDALWRRQHAAVLRFQQGSSWDEMAAAFEARVLEGDRRTGSQWING